MKNNEDLTEDHITRKQFSVVRFSADGTYAYVIRWVDLLQAVQALKKCTRDFASLVGATTRIIVIDGDDCINIEWTYGKGITYPTKEMIEESKQP